MKIPCKQSTRKGDKKGRVREGRKDIYIIQGHSRVRVEKKEMIQGHSQRTEQFEKGHISEAATRVPALLTQFLIKVFKKILLQIG